MKTRNVPTGWRLERLGEVVAINPDQLGEDTSGDALFEYVELSGVAGLNATLVSQQVRFAGAPSRARRRATNGDILVSTVRPNLQGFTRVRNAPANLVVSTGFAVLRPNGHADGGFLYQHILGDAFVQHLLPALVGSNYPAVNPDTIASYPVLLPPPAEQAKIAAVLGAVDEAVDRSRAVLAQTKTLRQALLHTLLTRGLPGRHTKFKTEEGQQGHGWPRVHIRDLCSDIIDCPHTTPHFTTNGVPVIRTTAVRDGALVAAELTYTTEAEYHARTSRLVPAAGDIVFTREAPVAEAFVVPSGMRLSLGQRTMLLRPRPNRLNAHYFVALLYEQSFRKHLMTLAGGSTTPHLNVAEVRDLSIPAPNRAIQDGVVDVLAGATARLAAAEAHLAQLERVKSALSAALLSGAVRVRVEGGAAAAPRAAASAAAAKKGVRA